MLQTAIGKVAKISKGTWEAMLTPSEVSGMGRAVAHESGPSIMLADKITETPDGSTIFFPPDTLTILNRGTSERAFVFARPTALAEVGIRSAGVGGDTDFLKEAARAGPDVERFSKRMLQEVRRLDPQGDLVRFPHHRFINKPDNFITLVPQPRVKELKVVVRGSAREFSNAPVDLKKDQNGYSTFKIRNASELACGVAMIEQIRRKP